MGIRRNAREWALQFLFQSEYNRASSLDEGLRLFWDDLDAIASRNSPAPVPASNAPVIPKNPGEVRQAREYATDLIRGVLQHHRDLDQRINACCDHWTIDRMGAIERNILRIAAFEILHRPDVPGPVSISEAIALAKIFSSVESAHFVNGILDHLYRSAAPAPGTPAPAEENA